MLQWIEIKHDQNRQHYFCFCLLSKICRCDDYDKVGQGNKGSCFKFFSWLCCGGDHILERTHWQIFQQYLCLALPGIFVQYLCSALGYLCNICARHWIFGYFGYFSNICAWRWDICAIFVLASGLLLQSAINNWNNFDFVVSLHKWSNTAKQRNTNGATL